MIHGLETIKRLNEEAIGKFKALSSEEQKRIKQRWQGKIDGEEDVQVVCEKCKKVVLEKTVIRGLCPECCK